MKGRFSVLIVSLLIVLTLGAAGATAQEVAPGAASRGAASQSAAPEGVDAVTAVMGAAFTYQGRLVDGGASANGNYDFQFKLYDAATAGAQVGGAILQTIAVIDGYFTTKLDFGEAFNGDARYLEIGVKIAGSSDPYTILDPRQELTPTPYALALPGLWTQQNATSPNMIGGYNANAITGGAVGATISGGGSSGAINTAGANFATVGGGIANLANGAGATVAGGGAAGAGNVASGAQAAVGGGIANIAAGTNAVIAGGESNSAAGGDAAVGGGFSNSAYADATTVSGGSDNLASELGAAVGGGNQNEASGRWSTVAGGGGNKAQGEHATVAGGSINTASVQYATVGGGVWNRADGVGATVAGGGAVGSGNLAGGAGAAVGGGIANVASGGNAVIAGGESNSAAGALSAVGGGFSNVADADGSTVSGGTDNAAAGAGATVGGGNQNVAGGGWSTVPGGGGNSAAGAYSFAAGRRAKALHDGAFVWGDSTDADIASTAPDEFVMRAAGGISLTLGSGAWRFEPHTESPNLIGGYSGNSVAAGVVGATIAGGGSGSEPSRMQMVGANYGTVSGGENNQANAPHGAVGGGQNNAANGSGHSTVAGGFWNVASGNTAVVAGGFTNAAQGDGSTVSGGANNTAGSTGAAIGGGAWNTAGGSNATIGGGHNNQASGGWATIGGGYGNKAEGDYATVAGGNLAQASVYGQMAYASGAFVAAGDAQTSVYVLRRTTTDATSTPLTLDGALLPLTVAAGRSMAFEILVVGRNDAGASAGYRMRGLIENVGGATAFVGTPVVTMLGEDVDAWNATVSADDTDDALYIWVTGAAETTIRWVATVHTAEVAW